MAAVDSLRTHLIEELSDLADAEAQLVDALPKLADAATAPELKAALKKHLGETRIHVKRLDRAFQALGETRQSKTCEGMKGLLDEGRATLDKTLEGAIRDAVLITGAQKVEHYEMASYGTARTYATVLGKPEVARLLEETLEEEKNADRTMTQIAEGSVNEGAAREINETPVEESMLERSSKWVAATAARAAATLGVKPGRTRSAKSRASSRSSSAGGSKRASGSGSSRKTASTSSSRKRGRSRPKASARERLRTQGDVRYARRDKDGRWNEMDDAGRSQRADRRKKAKRTAQSGQGDRGDRRPRSKPR